MTKNFLLILSLLSFAACTSVETIKGPDGTDNQLIRCSAGIKSCYEKATEVCGGKYKIVNTSTDVSGGPAGTGSTNNLLVKCEK